MHMVFSFLLILCHFLGKMQLRSTMAIFELPLSFYLVAQEAISRYNLVYMTRRNSPSHLQQPHDQPSYYFIGIGGIGMSALARYYKAQKMPVAGSDSQRSTITDELIKEGIRVKIGQKTAPKVFGGASRPSAVIYNRAIRPENPEFFAAQTAGIPLVPYAEALGAVTRAHDTIAITGSHGKSTTTALATVMLMRAGFDPTVLVGTKLADLGNRNMRIGKQKGNNGRRWLVLEADDYQAAFLHYSPSIAIVTNIDREHMDFYKTFANVRRAFLRFLSRTREGGTLILNKDDAPLWSMHTTIAALARKRSLRVMWYSRRDGTAARVRRALVLPGPHNLSNALAVYALGIRLGIPQAKILSALGAYRGAWRRMEYRGTITISRNHGLTAKAKPMRIKVFDDYAHHPSEIKATLAAFREKFPHTPLFVAFQPHQARRLAALFKEFQSAFDDVDAAWIAPIYQVAGRDEVAIRDSAALVRAMQKRAPHKLFFYLEDLARLGAALGKLCDTPLFEKDAQAILVMMGAGDIERSTGKILTYR
jgi:UDP-N-acetylmuramate--alanine ligase